MAGNRWLRRFIQSLARRLAMKYRPGPTMPYVAVVIASVVFAVLQPSFSAAPDVNALALSDLAVVSSISSTSR